MSSIFEKNLKKIESLMQLNFDQKELQKSSYWRQRIKEYNFKDPKSFLNSGGYTERSIKQIVFNYLNQRLYFSNLIGINIFNTDVYKSSLKIAKKQNRVLDYDFLRMVYTYYFITKIKKIKFSKICIIGDGKSTLTSIFKTMNPDIEIFYINLIEVLYQDYLILSMSKIIGEQDHVIVKDKSDFNFKKKIYFIPSYNLDFLRNRNIDLFLNIASFQEMKADILERYFEIIESNKSILYSCNRIKKELDDGSMVKLKDYPIKNGKIILNEQCPWHSFYYAPFFKKKYFDGVKEKKGINHQIISYKRENF